MSLLVSFVFAASFSFGQESPHSEMARANEALGRKDYVAYLEHMQRAVQWEPDKVGRPYFLYGLARAYAYNRFPEKAFETLNLILREGVETPMAFLSMKDPAFSEDRNHPEMMKIMERAKTLPIRITPAAGDVFSVEGAGCNLALWVKGDAMLLVDAGYPEVSESLARALQERFTGKELRFIVNTHEHYDHVGGNRRLGGNPVIIAHAGVRRALQESSDFFPDFSIPAFPSEQWPDLTFEEPLSLHLNGEEVRIVGFPAHSEGDSVVYFTRSGVLHMGDNFFPETTRLIYPGNNVSHFIENFGAFLNSLPDEITVMSGHAAPVPIARVREMFEKTEQPYRFVLEKMKEGKSLEEIKQLGEKEGYRSPNLEFFYSRLSE